MCENERATQKSMNDLVSLFCLDWFPPLILPALPQLCSSIFMQ